MSLHKSSDPNIFLLPDLGEGVHEAELISWKVKPGDTVEEHQIVAEMETDKALVEVPSPRSGVIKELMGNPGDILKVGEPAWTYEGAPSPAGSGRGKGEGSGVSASSTRPIRSESAPRADANSHATADEDAGTVVGSLSANKGVEPVEGKALATPAVRRLARELGVDIDSIRGTGLGGRVTEKDVRSAAGTPSPSGRGSSASGGGGEGHPRPPNTQRLATPVSRQEVIDRPLAPTARPVLIPTTTGSTIIPFRGVRRTIANRLRQSVDHAVHFTVMDEADVTTLDDVRQRLSAASGEKVSYLPFVVSAVCRAFLKFPALTAIVNDEKEEITRHSAVHIGIATDTDQGLTVPVIPNADSMGVLEIGRHISEIARATRDRTIPRERLMGSTFTISNVGSYAGRFATPIINYPEVGLLAVGRVHDGVAAKHGGIHVVKLLPLSLTCDHRCVDGAEAARCLAHLIELLGAPEDLLTPARG